MKKNVITGSLGHISRPIVQGLIAAGNDVHVITSSQDRAREIEKLGARPIVGQVQNADFVKEAFKGAEVVYTMIPPIWQTDNWRASQNEIARNYANAITGNGIKYVVNLSSIGAHLDRGVGPVGGLYDFEQMLNKVPGLNVRHLRPSYFYYNFLAQIGLVKQAGIIGGNYGADDKVYLVHTDDIAKAALHELLTLGFSGSSVRYIIGDERTGPEIARSIGKAIGKDIQWVQFTDEQQKDGLLQAGLPETHAAAYTEMGKALREGTMQADARKTRPQPADIKLEDFVKEFAEVFADEG